MALLFGKLNHGSLTELELHRRLQVLRIALEELGSISSVDDRMLVDHPSTGSCSVNTLSELLRLAKGPHGRKKEASGFVIFVRDGEL
jgi:hypothetical protein